MFEGVGDIVIRLDLEAAFDRLTDLQQEALTLHVRGYTQAEIAGLLGITQQAVSRRIARATASLCEYLT